ncbi:cupin domain-containing protein [Streptomyces sp. NPDC018029]|uniref:cupin domain-containing protein n=1 Tax=Streptomyces sp. NPDC018029 TaxID=3365032 RepID=UPI00379F5434
MSEPAGARPLFVGPERTGAPGSGQISVVWSLGGDGRDLDAAVVRLAPGADLGEHTENGCGILLTVLAGSGELRVPGEVLPLAPGALAWLPARTPRFLRAGEHGLTYTTAHRRRPLPETGPETAGGGEPACLLERVCPRCGRLAGERDARYCARCGTALAAAG